MSVLYYLKYPITHSVSWLVEGVCWVSSNAARERNMKEILMFRQSVVAEQQ